MLFNWGKPVKFIRRGGGVAPNHSFSGGISLEKGGRCQEGGEKDKREGTSVWG